MKVIDFGSGDAALVRLNWRIPNAGGPAFLDQSLIANVLGGVPNEIHCYDSLAIPKEETRQHLIGDIGKIVLHSDKRRLPRRVDMICAFHPDPRVIFGDQNRYGFNKKKTLAYSTYVSELAIMVDVRLKVGGILAIQFDDCMTSSEQPYDGTISFLERALPDTLNFYMKLLWRVHQSEIHRPTRPFEGLESYEFDSLHIFQKVGLKK